MFLLNLMVLLYVLFFSPFEGVLLTINLFHEKCRIFLEKKNTKSSHICFLDLYSLEFANGSNICPKALHQCPLSLKISLDFQARRCSMFGKNEAVGAVHRKKIGREGNTLQFFNSFICLCGCYKLPS